MNAEERKTMEARAKEHWDETHGEELDGDQLRLVLEFFPDHPQVDTTSMWKVLAYIKRLEARIKRLEDYIAKTEGVHFFNG